MVKLKEIPRTAHFAWSPASGEPLLVTGTASGAIDEDFSSSTQLELWDLSLKDHSADAFQLQPKLAIETDARFHDIAWGGVSASKPKGLIAGALESGLVLWDPETLSTNSAGEKLEKHSGAIHSIQFNPLQSHLLASGGSSGEVYVWDLNKTGTAPFSVGSRTSRHDEVDAVAWNNKVPHIMAMGGNTGFTTVWDLKNKREVLHLHYSGSSVGQRSAVSSVVWHPTDSTKLMTASKDDIDPVILLWDLRNGNAPEKIFKGHDKGVLSLDWCSLDSSFLLSGGRDNRTLLWNPESGERIGEYPIAVNWSFKTKFNPRIPDIFASASFDGKITVQTLQDVVVDSKKTTTNNTSEDFWDPSSYVDTLHPTFTLHQAPNWLKRPVSAAFGFGGKLVSVSTANGQSSVHISKFVEDESLSEETAKFATALQSNNVGDIVSQRLESAKDSNKYDWTLLSDLLAKGDTKSKLLKLVTPKEAESNGTAKDEPKTDSTETDDVFGTSGDDFLSELSITPKYVPEGSFSLFSDKQSKVEQDISKAILKGDLAGAVDICLKDGDISDAFLLALNADEKTKTKVANFYLSKNGADKPFLRLLNAVNDKDFDDLVQNSDLSEWRQVVSSLLMHCSDSSKFGSLVSHLGDRLLAQRGEAKTSEAADLRNSALLCYAAGSNLEKTSSIWLSEIHPSELEYLKSDTASSAHSAHVQALHTFIEKITIFREAVGAKTSPADKPELETLYDTYREYASLVASQGHLPLAERILNLLPSQHPGVSLEKERVLKATKKAPAAAARPAAPSAGRYGNIPVAAPLYPSATAPQTIIPGAGSPYAPVAPAAHGIPAPGVAPGIGSVPTAAPSQFVPASNPYQPAGASVIPLPPMVAATPSPPPPPPKKTSGWNDLPTSALPAPRRPPSSAQTIVQPFVGQQQPPAVGSGPAPLSRATSFTQPPLPPPPPPGAAVSSATTPAAPPLAPFSPPPPNPYAPSGNSAPSVPSPGYFGQQPPVQQPPARSILSPPPVNPYAPSAQQNQGSAVNSAYAPPPGAGGSSLGGLPPPPPSPGRPPVRGNFGAPPPVAAPPMSANTAAGTAAASVASPPPPQKVEPVAPPAPKYPPGDREHIPSSARPIFDLLSGELARVKPFMPANVERQVADADKRLNILFDHLNNDNLLTEDTVGDLVNLSRALAARDYDTASNIRMDILTTRADQCGQWMTGVKRLLDMSKAVP